MSIALPSVIVADQKSRTSSWWPCQPLLWCSSPPWPPCGPPSFARRPIVGTDHRVEARHQNQSAVYLSRLCVTKIKMSEEKRFQLNQEILKHWSSEALCTWTCIAFIKERSPEKMLSFGYCPNYLPSKMDNLYNFLTTAKIKIWKKVWDWKYYLIYNIYTT